MIALKCVHAAVAAAAKQKAPYTLKQISFAFHKSTLITRDFNCLYVCACKAYV